MFFLNEGADPKADCDSQAHYQEAVSNFYVNEVSLVDVRLRCKIAQDEQELEAKAKYPSEGCKVLIHVKRDLERKVGRRKGNQLGLATKLGVGVNCYTSHLDGEKQGVQSSKNLENAL